MTEVNSIVTSGVGESGFANPQNPPQNPQSQAVLTLFPIIDSQRPFLKEELWCVTLGGEVLRGPARRSECEAFANTWNRAMYGTTEEVLAHCDKLDPPVSEPEVFAVVLMRIPESSLWKPKGQQSVPPVENCNLKYRFARDIVNVLNDRLYESGKPRVYMVARAFGDAGRYFVAGTDTNANTNSERKILGVKQQGLTLGEARNEVSRINRLICETARYPKAWAVVAVDGSWSNGVDVAVTVGEAVSG